MGLLETNYEAQDIEGGLSHAPHKPTPVRSLPGVSAGRWWVVFVLTGVTLLSLHPYPSSAFVVLTDNVVSAPEGGVMP